MWLRRLGPAVLVLWAPLLAIPVVMLMTAGDRMSVLDWIAVVGGGAGSVVIYVATLIFVIRAYRRDYSEIFEQDVDDVGRQHDPSDS